MAKVFGLITEGPTDQLVLETIMVRYFQDPDIDILPMQPIKDATDESQHGGWSKVREYCCSEKMSSTLESSQMDYILIHIDTDICEDFGVPKRENGVDLKDEELVANIRKKIISWIHPHLVDSLGHKLILAISHSEIECWLLPLYFTDSKKSKTINCCSTLNQQLSKQGFTIDCINKRVREYERICKSINRKQVVEDISRHNHSFRLFIQTLAEIA